MIKKVIFAVVVVAIFASVAYQMGWLSGEGEDMFEDTRESVLEKGEVVVDKAKDAME